MVFLSRKEEEVSEMHYVVVFFSFFLKGLNVNKTEGEARTSTVEGNYKG